MKYISESQLNEILKKNENMNIHFKELKILFNYQLTDQLSGATNITQKVEQPAIQVTTDSKDYVILLDRYEDSSAPYLLIERKDPNILEVISEENKLHSLILEEKRVNKLISSKLGSLKKPFGKCEDLNTSVINHLDEAKDKYLKHFKDSLITHLSAVPITEHESDFSKKFVALKDKNILELGKLFEQHVDEIFALYKVDYDVIIEQDRVKLAQTMAENRETRRLEAIENTRIEEEKTAKANNDFILEKFGYYPIVETNLKNKELTFIGLNSEHSEIFKAVLPLTTVDIEYYDSNTGVDDVFTYYKLADNFEDKLNKSDYKKYYHAIFEVNDSIIVSKADVSVIEFIAGKDLSEFEGKDNTLLEDKAFSLSEIMKNNYSFEGRLKYVNDEMKSKFPTNKLKL